MHVSSIRLDGGTAALTISGAANTEVFQAYVGEVLCPSLRPGDIVVMDNLNSHKSEPTLDLIRAEGAQVLFLPAYSPDLNPIEKMWSKIKSILRTIEARTVDELIAAIGFALEKITQKDARGWFTLCGYSFL